MSFSRWKVMPEYTSYQKGYIHRTTYERTNTLLNARQLIAMSLDRKRRLDYFTQY